MVLTPFLPSSQFASLVMFSTMAAAKESDSARQYVVAIGVIMWLITSAIAVCYLFGYNDHLPVIHLDHQGNVLQITGKLTLVRATQQNRTSFFSLCFKPQSFDMNPNPNLSLRIFHFISSLSFCRSLFTTLSFPSYLSLLSSALHLTHTDQETPGPQQ